MKLSSSYGKRPTLAGGPVPIGTPLSWPKNSTIPAGFLNCSVADGTTYDITYYADLYGKIGTNVLPYYPPTSTNITIIKAKEEAIGIVTNADSLGNKPADYYEPRMFRNKIINGNFNIWQRGTSFTETSPIYGADRWLNNTGGSSCTMSRQSFTPGQTNVPNEPIYYCRIVVTSTAGAGNYSTLQHRIEDVRTLAGKTATLSFYSKADATRNIAIEFVQSFGSGGSTTVTNLGVTKLTLTTTWQKYIVTVGIPSITGKTVGDNSFLYFNIWFDAGSNHASRTNNLGQQSGTFDIAQVQLEEGSVATPFEQRPVGIELQLCQRYFYNTPNLTHWASLTSSGRQYLYNPIFKFPVTMRSTPTLTLSGTHIDYNIPIYLQVIRLGPDGFDFRNNGDGPTNPSDLYIGYTADAEL